MRRLFCLIFLAVFVASMILDMKINPVEASPHVVELGFTVEAFATGLDGPFGMVFDAEGNLYVANEGAGGGGTTVCKIIPDGTMSVYASGFLGPSGLAFDAEGTLFVSDDQSRIWKVYPNGTVTVFLEYDYGNPNAVAFDTDGNLIVVAHAGNVYRISPDASLSVIASGLNGPQSVTLDELDNTYVSDSEGTIFRISPSGSVEVFSAGVFHSSQGGLARDRDGNLYASESVEPDGKVYVFTPDGEGRPYIVGFEHYPRGLAFDSQGRLYVTEYEAGIIWRVKVALNKAWFDVEHGYWFATEKDTVSNTPMPCWHEWIFQMDNEPDESRRTILDPEISVLTEREFVSYYPSAPDVSNGGYRWNFSLELPEGMFLPAFAREPNFIEDRRPGIVAERHVMPETLSGPITIQNLTLDLIFADSLPENLKAVDVNIQMPNRNVFANNSLVSYSVISLSQMEDWDTGTVSWSANPHNISVGKTYHFSAVLNATKSPELLGSPLSKPGIAINYYASANYDEPMVGSSVTISHPEGPIVTFSSKGDSEWLGSVVYNKQAFAFNQVVSEIVENPDPPPPYVVKIPATLDIDPETLNLQSQGKWITAYIELPESYDVASINVSTLMLNDTVPAESTPTTSGDQDSDAIPGLKAKFNRTAISELILSEGIMFGNVTLTVNGRLNDGTAFEDNSVIVVKMPGDVNGDGKVDMRDIGIAANAFGSHQGQARWKPEANENEDSKIDLQDIGMIARHIGKTYL